MSLIPSESSSFADLLGRGLDGSKKSKWREPFAGPPPVDPPKSPVRSSSALKEKPQSEKVGKKTHKAPVVRKAEAKKPTALPIKNEKVPPPPPAAEPTPQVIEPKLKAETASPLFPPPEVLALDPAPVPEPVSTVQPVQFSELAALVQLFQPPQPVETPQPIEPPQTFQPAQPVQFPELIEAVQPVQLPQPIQPPQTFQTPQPVQAPQPLPPSQPVQAPQPIQRQPIIKAPLVIQPEDEPPRRPIPIVRVSRSKQHPHGNGRAMATETNGYDGSAPQPFYAEPSPVSLPPAPPRVRPKPLVMRSRAEEETQVPQPVIPAPREHIEYAQNVQPMSPPVMMDVQPDPVESDPWSVAERELMSESRPRRRFQLQWQSRLVRCLVFEAAAILALICTVLLGLAHRAPDDPLSLITRILAIGAAIVAAIIPVLFYGLPERFPRDPR